ncbi:hypothetical protein EalM132_00120 [Exiguobacterium phage vB_EalM-132]|nr:hypothetical protein EalM132_00120 [Exiguobacterium phage vB_EalM-132]
MKTTLVQGNVIIGVDFDGTITTERDMGHTLVLRDNCKECLTWLHNRGVHLVLWTCRTGNALEEALEFLNDHEMSHLFVAINDQIPSVVEMYPDTARKLGADFYIDDKNIFMSEVDWHDIYDHLVEKLQLSEWGKQ